MFTREELKIIKEATSNKNYLKSNEAQKAWDKGAADALKQSKE